ncbi:MAG: TldD/PmbA family protein [Candidatus Heimdallarchaeota archaeon]
MSAEEISADFLKQATLEQPSYADLRLQHLREQALIFVRQSAECSLLSSEDRFLRGVGVRALSTGDWGFASSNFSTRRGIGETVSTAIALARNSPISTMPRSVQLADYERTYTTEVTIPERQDALSMEEMIDQGISLLQSLDLPNYLSEIRLRIELIDERKLFVSTEGNQILQQKLAHISTIRCEARRGATKGTITLRAGGLGGNPFRTLEEANWLEKAIERSQDLLRARTIKSGSYPVILTPSAAWNLVHESLGHAVEADSVLSGKSVFSGLLGNKVASQLVTVVDDPSVPALGTYAFDDDGVKASGSIIVEDGLLSDYLHNRETAGALQTMSTGNSRAEGFSSFPLVRMSNFFVEPGDLKREELLHTRKKGIYIVNTSGGTADPFSGAFRLHVQLAFVVKGGEMSSPIQNFTVVGNMLSFLGRVNGVGNTMEQTAGICGKEGQIALQGALSPALRVSHLRIVSDY